MTPVGVGALTGGGSNVCRPPRLWKNTANH